MNRRVVVLVIAVILGIFSLAAASGDDDNLWRLEFNGYMKIEFPSEGAYGSDEWWGTAMFDFTLPEGDEGVIASQTSTTDRYMFTRVVPEGGLDIHMPGTGQAPLLIRGDVRDDVLTFTPACGGGSYYISAGGWYVEDELTAPPEDSDINEVSECLPVSMRLENGKEKTQGLFKMTSAGGLPMTSRGTWRLSGHKREHWMITMENWDKVDWGMTSAIGASVFYDWKLTTLVEIEDGRLTSAVATPQILSERPESDPPGVFRIEHWPRVPCLFGVSGRKIGRELWMNYPLSDATLTLVHWHVSLGDEDALRATSRTWGEENVQRMRERGVIELDDGFRMPTDTGVYILPLRNCVLNGDYGEIISIERLD